MRIETLSQLFQRDFNRLKNEIESYENTADLWIVQEGITNSAGNLVLHLCGNLQHFFGAVLLNSGYQRDREFEFEAKDLLLSQLLREVENAEKAVEETLAKLSLADLDRLYPLPVFGFEMTTDHFLVHLNGHLNYHLGQINYHRRLLTTETE